MRSKGTDTKREARRRLAEAIAKRYGVSLNANYLADCLSRRGNSPHKPAVQAVERDNHAAPGTAARVCPRAEPGGDALGVPEARLMADLVPEGVPHLERVVQGNLAATRGDPGLIRSLWRGSGLRFPERK
jgi:hypothetical protein